MGDSAILAVRPALLPPREDVRVGCSKEPFLELLLLEYSLRKCILFKDSMLRKGAKPQRFPSCQMQRGGREKKGKLLLWKL